MRKLASIAAIMLLPLSATACFGGGGGGSTTSGEATGQVTYWLWDANQLPAYQACADAFHGANQDVTIKISQYGWDDYWSKVTTGFVSGTAPDVFTDHLSKYPEFVSKQQLAPLDDFVSKDSVPTDIYESGLADLWKGPDGKRYGLPKDWDTIAVFYNKKMAAAAGVTADQLNTAAWNPTDGGTYEKIIAKLTVDKSGKHGDQPGFDKNNVKTYGLGLAGSGGGFGQTQWSMYAFSNGWQFNDQPTWGKKYNYDDPKFLETIGWWRGLIKKGYMPPLEKTVGVDGGQQLGAGNYALLTEGSWNTGALTSLKGVNVGIAPTPIGPIGKRASMFNGLGDSIWTGSKSIPAAWKWVKFLASPQCQDIVAGKAVVFPAITEAVPKAEQAFKAKGVDVSAFTVQVKDKTTHLAPVTDHGSDVTAIMTPAMDSVVGFKSDVNSLVQANKQVNQLFQ